VIAIPAYTEPIQSDVVIHDPPQVQENDEKEERSSFAELLAGLMQNVETENIYDAESALDALSAEKTKEGNKLNIFANAMENSIDLEGYEKTDLSDASIDKILSADHLFGSSLDADALGEDEIDAQTRDMLAQLASKKDAAPKDASALSEKTVTDPAVQLAAAMNASGKTNFNEEEAQALESGKKRRGGIEQVSAEKEARNEKIESLSSHNKAGEENASLLNKRDEAPNRLDEFRSRRKDRVSFEIHDQRTTTGMPNNVSGAYTLVETSAMRGIGQTGVQEITLDLRIPDYSQSSQAQTSWDTKASAAMENMLARELHQNFNGDIVRHASMALRDGGAGTIKIALHPETLGTVKIHLEMSDNRITGVIVVESEEAMNAFRREIASLEQAFKESGFSEASLDLSFTADGADAQQYELDDSSYEAQYAASSYEDSYYQEAPGIDSYFGHDTGTVNMLA